MWLTMNTVRACAVLAASRRVRTSPSPNSTAGLPLIAFSIHFGRFAGLDCVKWTPAPDASFHAATKPLESVKFPGSEASSQ